MTDIKIGSDLLEIRPYRDSRSGEPDRYRVTGETRSSWVAREVASNGSLTPFEVKIDKATMLQRGRGDRKAKYVTPEAWEHSKRRSAAESKVRDAVSGWSWHRELTDAQLDAIAAILGIEGYQPLADRGTEST